MNTRPTGLQWAITIAVIVVVVVLFTAVIPDFTGLPRWISSLIGLAVAFALGQGLRRAFRRKTDS